MPKAEGVWKKILEREKRKSKKIKIRKKYIYNELIPTSSCPVNHDILKKYF